MRVYLCFIFVLVTIISVQAANSQGKKCGQHEAWTDCGVSEGCVKTCANRDIQITCQQVCVPGCFCKKHYIRKYKNGPCILKRDCVY